LLKAILSGAQPKTLWSEGEAKGVRDRLRDAFDGPSAWGPHTIFRGLDEHLPKDALVSVDSGAHRILLSQMWHSAQPFGLAQSSGWCTMGSAIPLAVGRKLTHPERRVVAVLGDGGLEMTLGELGTLRDQGLAVTVLVLQDGSLELIGQKQDQAALARRAVAMGRTDYARIAGAFGGQGFKVTSEEELAAALLASQELKGFSLIVCEIADHGYAGWI
jgi:acetolactate synthase-1/2/3 large subunit